MTIRSSKVSSTKSPSTLGAIRHALGGAPHTPHYDRLRARMAAIDEASKALRRVSTAIQGKNKERISKGMLTP